MELYLILMGVFLLCIIVWGITSIGGEKKEFRKRYNQLYHPLITAQGFHAQNMDHLNKIGFHADRTENIGRKHFMFDHTKLLTCFEEFYINDGFLSVPKNKPQLLLPFIDNGASYCQPLKVFRYDKIIDCVLIQDGSVVKTSEGSAILAGTSVPYLGLLQGKASSSSDERQTGILSVRLTLDDIQNPSVLFTFSGNMDKSSAAYAESFTQAQQVFGIFDAIVRINKKTTASPQNTAPAQTVRAAQSTVASQPAASENESVFDTIRQLGKLRDDGILTEEEFNQKKKLLLEQIK